MKIDTYYSLSVIYLTAGNSNLQEAKENSST